MKALDMAEVSMGMLWIASRDAHTSAAEATLVGSCTSCVRKILRDLAQRCWWCDWGRAGVPLLAKIITKRSSIIVLNVHTPVDQLRERSYGTDELYAILQPLIFMLHLNDELCCCLNCFEILSASFSAIPVAQL